MQTIAQSTASRSAISYPLTRQTTRKPARHRPSTTEAYSRDVARLIASYGPLPHSGDDLAKYIAQVARRLSPATVLRRCAAIRDAHVRAGHPSPTDDPRIREAIRHMASGKLPINLLGTPKSGKQTVAASIAKRQAKPMTRTLLHRILDIGTGKRTMDKRDAAILLLGFSGLKRSTICAINIEDISFTEDAALIHVGMRVDSAGEQPVEKGRIIAIPFTRGPLCAASAVRTWLEHNGMMNQTGPLFVRFTRSGEPVWGERLDSAFVSCIVKNRLAAAGVEHVSEYSAESLRKGNALETIKHRR